MKSLIARRDLLTKDAGAIFRVLAALTWLFFYSPSAPSQIAKISVLEQFRTQDQHFSCTVEYAPAKCVHDLQKLRHLLEQYNAERLGEWQWVVVSRSEWKPFCVKLGVDFESPAMTSFLDRQAFFDEGLFDSDPTRSPELTRKFGAPWKDLLPLAVTHELGHAVCRDAAETRAELFAYELRQHRPGRCYSTAEVSIWSRQVNSPGR